MDGRPLRELLREDVLHAAPSRPVKTYEDAAWLQARAAARAHAAEIERNFEQELRRLSDSERRRLRSLGYTGEGLDADTNNEKRAPTKSPEDHH